jgi:hypothetical protein
MLGKERVGARGLDSVATGVEAVRVAVEEFDEFGCLLGRVKGADAAGAYA